MPSGAESKIREAIDIALKHQAEGRLRAAGNIYRRVLRVEPQNPDALHFLGVIAHKIGRPDLAMELLGRSIAADPNRVGFRLNLGSLYLKRQQVDEAIACYRDAIALEPASASAHAHLAAALARQGKLEEANQAYERATRLKSLPRHAVPPPVEPAAPVSASETTQPPPADMEAPLPAPDVLQDQHGSAETLGLADEPAGEPDAGRECQELQASQSAAGTAGVVPEALALSSTSTDERPSACHAISEQAEPSPVPEDSPLMEPGSTEAFHLTDDCSTDLEPSEDSEPPVEVSFEAEPAPPEELSERPIEIALSAEMSIPLEWPIASEPDLESARGLAESSTGIPPEPAEESPEQSTEAAPSAQTPIPLEWPIESEPVTESASALAESSIEIPPEPAEEDLEQPLEAAPSTGSGQAPSVEREIPNEPQFTSGPLLAQELAAAAEDAVPRAANAESAPGEELTEQPIDIAPSAETEASLEWPIASEPASESASAFAESSMGISAEPAEEDLEQPQEAASSTGSGQAPSAEREVPNEPQLTSVATEESAAAAEDALPRAANAEPTPAASPEQSTEAAPSAQTPLPLEWPIASEPVFDDAIAFAESSMGISAEPAEETLEHPLEAVASTASGQAPSAEPEVPNEPAPIEELPGQPIEIAPSAQAPLPLEWPIASEPVFDDASAYLEPMLEIAPEPAEDTSAGELASAAGDVIPATANAEPAPVVDQASIDDVLTVPIEFVIPVDPEPASVESASPVADLSPPASIDFVVPVEPEESRMTASGESAAHAARAALALQYAWALHFGPAHRVPLPAGKVFGIRDKDSPLEQGFFALPMDGSAEATAAPDSRAAVPAPRTLVAGESVRDPDASEIASQIAHESAPVDAILPLPDPDPVESDQADEAARSGIEGAAARGSWSQNSGPTALPTLSDTMFEDATYVDLGLQDDPSEPVTEGNERCNEGDAGAGPAQTGPMADEDAAEEPFELDDDAPLENEPVVPGLPDWPERTDAAVERSPEPAFEGLSDDEAAAPLATEEPAAALPFAQAVEPDGASNPAFLLAKAIDVSAAVEAAHVRPGLLGEAHARVLAGGFEPTADEVAAPPVDRLAETLPLPGTPALRSFRGPAGPAPAAGRGRPPSAESLRRRGVTLIGVRRLDEAIHLLNRAVALRPKFAEAHRDLGGAMLRQGNLEGAIASLQQALKLRPTFAEAWGSLGDAYQLEGKITQAIRCYRRVLELVPRAAKVHSNMLLSMNYDPKFSAEEVFHEHLRWAERHAEQHLRDIQPHTNDRSPNRRLMIGYVSPDFRRHSVNYFAEPVLAGHSRPNFHVTCYSDVIRPDGVTRGLAELSDDFRDTHAMSDEQLAARVRADGIDILVDLSGHTGNNRLGAFARKPAPIQVTYLGYPNTTGLSTIDYRITDALADPPGETERFHSEQLIRLPDTFLCYQPPKGSPEVGPLPCLTAGYVTFGCFNILAKITDQVMTLWARILQELPDSRLVLKGRSNALSAENRRQHVRDIFVNHGISPDRLELLGKEPRYAQHLTHYSRLDIVLDPFPYNGTTTTCEALWMGLPVVTLAGERHVSRVGVSILSNVGLPELIASTPEQYIQIATSLADSPTDLSGLRSTLRDRMHNSPLTDSIRLTRALEAEYRSMWLRWCQSGSGSPAPRDTLTLADG